MTTPTVAAPHVTAFVRRRIKDGSEAHFEELMQEFVAFVLRQPGHLGINVIRPSDGSRDYTVLDHFATEEDRRRFTSSSEYCDWMRRLRHLSEADPEIEEMGGLASWFTLPGRPARRPPPKHKMALVTLAGVYPLAMLFPHLVQPLAANWPGWFVTLVIASLLVVSLTWVVMPNLTRLFEKWLFQKEA